MARLLPINKCGECYFRIAGTENKIGYVCGHPDLKDLPEKARLSNYYDLRDDCPLDKE